MKKFLSTALCVSAVFAVSSLHAAPLYWDPNATTGTALGGTGNWDEVGNFWYNGTADTIWTSVNGDDAYFTGTAGTVTLVSSITAGNLYFTNTTGSYLLTNATGTEVLTLVNGTIDTGDSNQVISVPIGGSAQITKAGAGRAHFTADNTFTYAGPEFLVNNGFVSMENTNGLVPSTASIVVADGAALELNAITNGISTFSPITVSGAGPTGNGVIDNISGANFYQGPVTLTTNATFGIDGGTLEFDGGINGSSDLNVNIVGTNSTGLMRLTAGGFYIGDNGTLTVDCAGTFQLNQSAAYTTTFSNLVVNSGFFQLGGQEANLGNVPSTLLTNQIYLNGGGLSSSFSSFIFNTKRGITIGTNGGSITVISGNITTCGIYSDNNPVTFNCTGGNATDLTLGAPLNLGTAGYTKNGPMTMNLNGKANIVGSVTVNQGNLSWGTSTTPLGPVPSSFVTNWLTLNGGNILPSNSQVVEANRGVFLGSKGGGIGENTSGGNLTIAGVISGPGALTKLQGGANSSVILSANNTFTGKVTVQAYNLKVGSGGSTGTLGNGNSVVLSSTTANLNFNRSDANYSYGGVISGTGNVTNNGSGTITLTGANTYSGGTTLNNGKILVNNTAGSGTGTGAVIVQNKATLGGTGSIGGEVTINAGGTLSPGTPSSPLGKLTINNNLTLAGNLAVSVNRTLQTNSLVAVTGTLANTGTTNRITVTNLGPALVAGDKFYLFNQAISGGDTLQIIGASGVTWSNNLAVDGSIVVSVAPASTPVINRFSLSGTNLVLSGTNGYSNGGFYLLSTTNISLPLGSWSRVLTNTFDGSGNFSITNDVGTNSQHFYMLQLQ